MISFHNILLIWPLLWKISYILLEYISCSKWCLNSNHLCTLCKCLTTISSLITVQFSITNFDSKVLQALWMTIRTRIDKITYYWISGNLMQCKVYDELLLIRLSYIYNRWGQRGWGQTDDQIWTPAKGHKNCEKERVSDEERRLQIWLI